MIHTIELIPGVILRCCRDHRFKQGCLSLQIIRPMQAEENAMNALLPSVLLRGTNRHGDLRAITEYLDELYGATVSAVVRRVGDYQTTGLYCAFMDERFALPGDRVFAPMVEFLRELLLDSPVEDGGFRKAFVESEKKNLIATIEAELNDKRVYAMNRMLERMCREDSYGNPRLGRKDDVAAIDPVTLYTHYRKILKESPIHLFYVGSAPAEEVAELIRPMFAGWERNPMELEPQTAFHTCPGETLTETMEISQGKLCMGFATPIHIRTKEFPAMQVMNTIFGSGMTSKLFQTIREKMSLCYSIGSGYYGSKGLVTVSAGIDFDKEELTRQEVLHQLSLCQSGEISDEELTAAREAILSSLRSTHDSPGAIEGYYSSAALSGIGMTPAEYMAAVEAVTREQVVAAANTLTLHTTYFLKGGSQ